jgi:putative membrane protein
MLHQHSHHEVSQIGFMELWSPGTMFFTMAVAIFYFAVTGPLRDRFPYLTPGTTKQKVLFSLGLVVFYMATGSPLDYYGHLLFSAHMFQQSLLYYVMPPLLILGTPISVLEVLAKNNWFKRIILVRPMVAVFLFNLLFSMYHLPIVFDTVMTYSSLMFLSHLILMITAMQMWWPIISPLPQLDRLSDLRKIAYIICGAVLLTPACALIIFAPSRIYETYLGAPQFFWFLTAMDDQQLGGVVMKLIQELSFGTALSYIFFQWFRKERHDDPIVSDPLPAQNK